jgi:hemolysin activation/secretion protein
MTSDGRHAVRRLGIALEALRIIMAAVALASISSTAWGQAAPVIPPPLPPERPTLPEEAPLPRPPARVLPPVPLTPEEELGRRLPAMRVFILEIRVTGSTVLTGEELRTIAAPYVNREVTSEDLEALRLALTLAYVGKGYVTSGAIIPDQTVTDGVITFQIVEGRLAGIEVEGNEWFRARYIQDRLALGARPPVNIVALQERLQLLQQDDRLQRLNAELKAGVAPGESVLKVRVAETNPYKMWLEFNNYQSPSVGAERGTVTVAHQNLTGNGDIASFKFGKSAGVNPQMEGRYLLPVTARDTTVLLQYRKNDFRVVDPTFEALNIESESQIYGVTVRHPVYRTLNQEFALALTAEHLRNKLFVGGAPDRFFSIGARNGEMVVSALRFSQEWLHRSPNQVIAVNSRLSFGIDVLDAVNDGDPGVLREATDQKFPDGEFVAWLGQFQYARRLDPWGIQIIGRTDCQLANDRLFSLEQISVGGRYSVRGYRENEFVRDNGLIASLEARIPVVRSPLGADILQVVPFVDFGRSWTRKIANAHGDTLTSAGLGMILNILEGGRFEAYWGKRLNPVPVPDRGKDIQDFGFHIQLTVMVQ